MPQGRLLVTDATGDEQVHLYNWHSGTTRDALAALVELPRRVFEAARIAAIERFVHGELPPGDGDLGWHYTLVCTTLATMEAIDADRTAGVLRLTDALEITALSLANKLVWHAFNRWHIVPALDWTPDLGEHSPVAAVATTPSSYLVTAVMDALEPAEWLVLRGSIEQSNSRVSSAGAIAADVRVAGCHELQVRGECELIQLRVPFFALIRDMCRVDATTTLEKIKDLSMTDDYLRSLRRQFGKDLPASSTKGSKRVPGKR